MKYIATLYDKTGKNKLGELTEILAGNHYVEEERNGVFELSFDYPNGYPLADLLIDENMVEVKPNDTQDLQKFRIYDTKCLMKDIITIFARHESFDLVNDHVENINLENASCEYALNTLFRNSHFSKHYRGYSDIVAAQNYSIDNVNILNAIAGKEGSIIDTYGTGAEILRDGTNIHVLNKRGHDNEVIIEFGKNLTDFVLERDLTDLETRVGGFAKYTIEDNKEVVVKSNWIDSPYIDNFAHPYISIEGRRDYSDKFKEGEIPTVEKLDKLCADEFKINKRDIPKSNYTIKFIPLSKCVGYEGIQDKISLCDTVRIIDKRFNVDTKAKVIKYKYDFIKERYESMELGEPRTTLGDIIGNGGKGEQGPPGPPGKDGADGNIGDFPNSLPTIPILTASVKGFASIDLSWTYEDKVYYTYELYASKTKDFTPNTFDLIHEGQSSSFLFQVKPNETWYFRVCAKNTHGERTEFSPQVVATTKKIDDLSNYVDNMAIGEALIGELSLDRGWVGKLNANYLDVKGNFSVTNGNGVRTFDIDSFGDAYLNVRKLQINSVDVAKVDKLENNVNMIKNSSVLYSLDGFEAIDCNIERFDSMSNPNMYPTKLHFINTNNTGDCILIQHNNKNVLLDSNTAGSAQYVIAYLKSIGVTHLDYILVSHFHTDHAGGFPQILDAFDTTGAIARYRSPEWNKMPTIETEWGTRECHDAFVAKLMEKNIYLGGTPYEGEKLWLSDDCYLEYRNTNFQDYADYNNLSIVIKMVHKNKKIFLSGDIAPQAQVALSGHIGKVDMYKCEHHCYNESAHEPFIDELSPSYAVTTRGEQSIGIRTSTHGMLQARGIPNYLLSHIPNAVVVTSDGNNIGINTSNNYIWEQQWWNKNQAGNWYWFKQGGLLAKDETLLINGTWRHFDEKGVCTNPN